MSKKQTPTPQKPAKPGILTVLLRRICLWYTGISLFILLINVFSSTNEGTYVDAKRFLLFFPLALALAAAGVVRETETLPTWARVILHPLLSIGGVYLCFFLPYQVQQGANPGRGAALILITAMGYGIVALILFLCSRKAAQKKIDSTPYESQFKPRS